MTNNISRRGFLGVVSAFTAAVATGIKMPMAGQPTIPVQDDLLAMLRSHKVRAVEYWHECSLGKPPMITVNYVYDSEYRSDKKTPIEEFVEDKIARYSMRPVNVTTVRSHDRLSETTVVFM